MSEFKVLLVSPQSYPPDVEMKDQKITPFRMLPYSIIYLFNFLKKHASCDVDFVDLVEEKEEDFFSKISKKKYDLIGFTATVHARFYVIKLIKKAKEYSPLSKVIHKNNNFRLWITFSIHLIKR